MNLIKSTLNQMLKWKSFEKFMKQYDKKSLRPFLYRFVMTEPEKEVFNEEVKNAKFYLEFGFGGSTLQVLKKSKAKIYSVDSSEEWLETMREYKFIRKNEGKCLFLFVEYIGETGDWGMPINDEKKELFPNYSSKIFEKIPKEKIDVVLIDGRFRVACTLKTILECHNNKGLRIMIHDFWNREKYHVVLEHLNTLKEVDRLGIFEIKEDVDLQLVQIEYDKYKFIPD